MFLETLEMCHGEKKKATIFTIDISASNEVVTGGGDGKITLWSTKQSFTHHSGAVLCVRFSPSGNHIASGSDDKTVNVYRRDGRFVFAKKLSDHKSDVVGLAWTGELLLSAGCDGVINIYDAAHFGLVRKIEENVSLKGLAVDPAWKYICIHHDKGIKLYDIQGNYVAQNEDIGKGNVTECFFSRMSFSSDSRFVAVGLSFNNRANCVEILDMHMNSTYSLLGHAAPSEVVAFNPNVFKRDEKYYVIAVASQDRSISLWNSSNPKPFLLLKNIVEAPVLDMRWSLDGGALLVCTYDGEVKRMQFKKNELGTVCSSAEGESKLPLTYEYYELGKEAKTEKLPGDSHVENNVVAAAAKPPVKRIKPVLVAPLEEKGGLVQSKTEAELWIFKGVKRPCIDRSRIENFVKVIGEYRIEYHTNHPELKVFRGTKLYFSAKGAVSHVSANKNYLVIVYGDGGHDKVKVLDTESCNLEMPTFYSCGVATVDVMDDCLLVVEVTGDFKVVSLKRRRKVCGGVLPFKGQVKINFCRKYFLVADCDGRLHFYCRRTDTWFRKREDYDSVCTSKTDFLEPTDETFEDFNYRFAVSREAGCVEDMRKHAKKMFDVALDLEGMDELRENKMCSVVVALVRVGEAAFASVLLDTLCKNYSLHYFVHDMRRMIREVCAKPEVY